MKQKSEEEGEKRVGIWVRVSPRSIDERKGAEAKSESPEHHLRRAELYAEMKGWTVVETYRLIDVSGKDVANHPETRRMLADVRAGKISGLIFSKLARLGRKTDVLIHFLEVFRECDADLISLDETIDTTTPAGRNFFRFQASNAEWEREEIAERMQASIKIRARLGKQISGSSPYGYRWEKGQLVPDPDEAPVRRLIYELYLEHRRKGTVARLLNQRGHRTRKGGPFTALAIERLIRDPTAKGVHRANYTTRSADNTRTLLKPESEWHLREVEAVVPEDLWTRCNEILEANRKPAMRPAKRAVQLFAGLVFCSCGEKMYVPSNTPKYVCQRCRTKIPKDTLEQVFKDDLRTFFRSPVDLSRHLEEADQVLSERVALLEQLEREQARLSGQMEKTYRLYLEDAISLDGFRDLYRPLEVRQAQLAEELPRLQSEVDSIRMHNLSKEQIAEEGRSLFDRWDTLGHEERRAIIETITQRITVNGDEIETVLCFRPPPGDNVANSPRSPPARTRGPVWSTPAGSQQGRHGRGRPRPYGVPRESRGFGPNQSPLSRLRERVASLSEPGEGPRGPAYAPGAATTDDLFPPAGKTLQSRAGVLPPDA